jgi:quercetin dioxygenase-like cupin family protein
VPQSEGVHFKPLCFNVTHGYFVNLLRVRKSGVLSRHYHTNPVHAYVLKGRWYYLEHDWVAEEGSYAMEPPGETHTLVVPEDVAEMITLFYVTGSKKANFWPERWPSAQTIIIGGGQLLEPRTAVRCSRSTDEKFLTRSP